MINLARKYPGRAQGYEAEAALTAAYRNVFLPGTSPSDEDRDLVLTDLANVSGFYGVSDFGTSPEDRAMRDGMRAIYAHIHGYLRMTEDKLRALEEAAWNEAQAYARHNLGTTND